MGSEPTSPRKSFATGLLKSANPMSAPQRRGGDASAGSRRESRQAERREEGGDRHHLGDGDPIEPVHEVDEVHEPDAAKQQKRALDHERNRLGQDADLHCEEHGHDRQHLEEKPRARGQRPDVVDARRRDRAPRAAAATIANGTGDAPAHNERRRRDRRAWPPITAMPPPCGVGIRWLERAFGRASA